MTEAKNIALNPDQQAVAHRVVRDLQFAVGTIDQQLQTSGTVQEELARNVLRVSEHALADLAALLGVPSQTRVEIEERNARLKAANMRVHELEAQLGATQSPAQVRLGIKVLDERLNDWWDLEGFGHISKRHFGAYGCEVTFCCHLFGNFSLTNSATPVSDKSRRAQWLDSLQERGFELGGDEDREPVLVDNDRNRALICGLVTSRMPSARVQAFENTNIRNTDKFALREVRVWVPDFDDILGLPIPAPQG